MESGAVFGEARRITLEMLQSIQDQMCSICQSNFQVRQYVLGLECGHGFHADCFQRWAQEVTLKEYNTHLP